MRSTLKKYAAAGNNASAAMKPLPQESGFSQPRAGRVFMQSYVSARYHAAMPFALASPAFAAGGLIPSRYTCDGENLSPPLAIMDPPAGTKSFALIVEDPDIPDEVRRARGIAIADHWLVFNIPPDTREIPEGVSPGLCRGAGCGAYRGPCPPPDLEPRTHRYFFKLYALDRDLWLPPDATKQQVLAKVDGHKLGETALMGRYARLLH